MLTNAVYISTGVPGISKTSRGSGGGVVRFHPAVLSPTFGRLAELLLVLLLTLDVLCIRLDPVTLCIAAGVHSCVMRWRHYLLSDYNNIVCADDRVQSGASDSPICTWSVWLRDTNADVSSIHETWMFPEWITGVESESSMGHTCVQAEISGKNHVLPKALKSW